MEKEKTDLHKRIESGDPLLLAEISPPKGSDPEPVRDVARQYAGKVHALGICDNRDGVCMSALAAASLAAAEGVEPILHTVTRDRNRIALISDLLGSEALGVRNVLCTTGTHQTLGPSRAAKNVFDIDSIQLLRTLSDLPSGASLVGEENLNGAGPFCLGGVASPYADPLEMQMIRLSKKVSAGARFLVTEPVFDIDRFDTWWKEVTARGIHEKVAIVAGIRPLASAEDAKAYAVKRPLPTIPQAVLERVTSKTDVDNQRKAGIEIALETIEQLAGMSGLRGFSIQADGSAEAVLEIIEKSGRGAN
jgi:methylenetetrahydrofolate reductase (NADH)